MMESNETSFLLIYNDNDNDDDDDCVDNLILNAEFVCAGIIQKLKMTSKLCSTVIPIEHELQK